MINQETIQGTLKPDGTLVLNGSLKLSPGPVQITVQPLATAPPGKRGLVEVMDEIRRAQIARGYTGRTLEEMQTEEAVHQEEDEAYDRRCRSLGTLP